MYLSFNILYELVKKMINLLNNLFFQMIKIIFIVFLLKKYLIIDLYHIIQFRQICIFIYFQH